MLCQGVKVVDFHHQHVTSDVLFKIHLHQRSRSTRSEDIFYLVRSCRHFLSLSVLHFWHERARGSVRSSYISLLSQCQESTLQGLTMLTWFYTICSLLPGHNTVLASCGLCWVLTLTNRQATAKRFRDLHAAHAKTQLDTLLRTHYCTCTHFPSMLVHTHKQGHSNTFTHTVVETCSQNWPRLQ